MQNAAFITQLTEQFIKLQPYLPGSNELNVRHLRNEAITQLKKIGLPHKKQDTWKYATLGSLAEIPFKVYTHPSAAISLSLLTPFIVNEEKDNVLVFLNGYHLPSLSHTHDVSHGLTLTHFKHLSRTQPDLLYELIAKGQTPKQFFGQMNSALTTDGALLIIAQDKEIKHPIHIYYFLVNPSQNPTMANTQTHIFVEKNAKATIIEHHITLSEQAVCFNTQTHLHCHNGAKLHYSKVSQHDKNTYSFSALQAHLYDACVTINDIELGGKYQRHDNHIVFNEKQSDLKICGLLVPTSSGHIDCVYHVHHQVPCCQSSMNMKALVGEHGHSSFLGKIFVAKNAQKTLTNMQNKNLLVGQSGIADSLPQFEILADDVKCSHGSTVSKLDEHQLYYLQSRGLDDKLARELMINAFIKDVLESFGPQKLSKRVLDYIQSQT